jgi:hypothetical protein
LELVALAFDLPLALGPVEGSLDVRREYLREVELRLGDPLVLGRSRAEHAVVAQREYHLGLYRRLGL